MASTIRKKVNVARNDALTSLVIVRTAGALTVDQLRGTIINDYGNDSFSGPLLLERLHCLSLCSLDDFWRWRTGHGRCKVLVCPPRVLLKLELESLELPVDAFRLAHKVQWTIFGVNLAFCPAFAN